MITIRFNPLAVSDLEEIKEYISQDNPEAAIRTVKELIEKAEALISFPNRGISLGSKLGIKTKYKYLICGQYLIFYIFENEVVSIMRIIHGKRDYLSILDIDRL